MMWLHTSKQQHLDFQKNASQQLHLSNRLIRMNCLQSGKQHQRNTRLITRIWAALKQVVIWPRTVIHHINIEEMIMKTDTRPYVEDTNRFGIYAMLLDCKCEKCGWIGSPHKTAKIPRAPVAPIFAPPVGKCPSCSGDAYLLNPLDKRWDFRPTAI